jgi:outer membrane protein OmpA-like peptidoglycan-associated protein
MSRFLVGMLAVLALSAATVPAAESQTPEDPVPAGARGTVLAIAGEVRPIVGLSSGLAGRVDALAAALKDLGARTTETEIRIELAADVLFDFDKADIKAEAEPALEKLATVLRSYPGSAVTVEGHTDAKGSDQYNQRLSEHRAAAVVTWLRARAGLGDANLATRGWGASRPLAPNRKPDGSDDPDGRQKNRRVEVVVRK